MKLKFITVLMLINLPSIALEDIKKPKDTSNNNSIEKKSIYDKIKIVSGEIIINQNSDGNLNNIAIETQKENDQDTSNNNSIEKKKIENKSIYDKIKIE